MERVLPLPHSGPMPPAPPAVRHQANNEGKVTVSHDKWRAGPAEGGRVRRATARGLGLHDPPGAGRIHTAPVLRAFIREPETGPVWEHLPAVRDVILRRGLWRWCKHTPEVWTTVHGEGGVKATAMVDGRQERLRGLGVPDWTTQGKPSGGLASQGAREGAGDGGRHAGGPTGDAATELDSPTGWGTLIPPNTRGQVAALRSEGRCRQLSQ